MPPKPTSPSRLFAKSPSGTSPRCGRCADLLPDETLTYCPMCGVPFSQVGPTHSYTLIADQIIQRALQSERRRWGAVLGLFAILILSLQVLMSHVRKQYLISQLSPEPRKIQIFDLEFDAFPKLPPAIKRLGTGYAIQAFEDHFGITLNSLSIQNRDLPPELDEIFFELNNSLADPNSQFTKLSYWEKSVFPKLTEIWSQDPYRELPVVVTNFPIYADSSEPTQIETRHLGSAKLVSGLGHPALVLVSTFRMNEKSNPKQDDLPEFRNLFDQARFLGEYILAHELGHGILGLTDTIITDKPTIASIRSPASITEKHGADSGKALEQCLMHTDSGGGHRAWKALRDRPLGSPSPCAQYTSLTNAFELRNQSIRLLKLGFRKEAEEIHSKALAQAKIIGQPWVHQLWSRESYLFERFP